jgi:diketogulonate reductase-like aldo/keto reductase
MRAFSWAVHQTIPRGTGGMSRIGTSTIWPRVALAWTLLNRGTAASIVGARTLAHLDDNLGALDIELDRTQQARLEEASAIDLGSPHDALRRLGFAP